MKQRKDRKKRASKLQFAATPEGREIIAKIADYRRGSKALSYSQIAAKLNEEGLRGLKGGAWYFKLVEYYAKQAATVLNGQKAA